MSEAKRRKRKQDDPIAKKLLNGEPLTWDEARERIVLKLDQDVKQATWIYPNDRPAEELKRMFSSAYLAIFLKEKDRQDDTIEERRHSLPRFPRHAENGRFGQRRVKNLFWKLRG